MLLLQRLEVMLEVRMMMRRVPLAVAVGVGVRGKCVRQP